jgi:transposase-like protein
MDRELGKTCMIKSIKTTSVKCRRRFDETFKREAVQNWLGSGKSAAVVAEELGLTANLLYAWRKLVPAAAGGRAAAVKPGSVADLQGQLDAAQRELRHVREQCLILKKTLGILSEPPSNGMNGSTR